MVQARSWGKETIAGGGLNNKQFNDYVPPADPLSQFFAAPEHDVDAARAEGRRRFGRRAGRAEPRLHQHRPVQRGVAAALPPAPRRQPISPIPIETAREELRLLAGDREADAQHGALLPRQHGSAPPEGCAGRRAYLDRRTRRCSRAASRLRRPLRALPLEQAAAAAGRARSGDANGPGYLDCVEHLLGVDEDRRIQDADARDRRSRTISSTATISRASSGCRSTLLGINACSPLATNAHPRQHLGQFLVRVLQDAAVGRHDHDPSPGDRRGDAITRCRRRPRLHPAGVARQRVVNRAVPAEQHRRAVRMRSDRRHADARIRRRDRADAAGSSRATATACSRTRSTTTIRVSAGSIASPPTAILKCRRTTCPALFAVWSGCSIVCFPSSAATARRSRSDRFRQACPLASSPTSICSGRELSPSDQRAHHRASCATPPACA